MSNDAANHETGPTTLTTIAEVFQGIEPMGDLRQFGVNDDRRHHLSGVLE